MTDEKAKIFVGIDKKNNHYIMEYKNLPWDYYLYINGIRFSGKLPIGYNPTKDKIELKKIKDVLHHYEDENGNIIPVEEFQSKKEDIQNALITCWNDDGPFFDTNENKKKYYAFLKKYKKIYQTAEVLRDFEIIKITFMDIENSFIKHIPHIVNTEKINWNNIETGDSFIYDPIYKELFKMVMEKEFPNVEYNAKYSNSYTILDNYFSDLSASFREKWYISFEEAEKKFESDYNWLKDKIKEHILKAKSTKIYNFGIIMKELSRLKNLIIKSYNMSNKRSAIVNKIDALKKKIIEETDYPKGGDKNN